MLLRSVSGVRGIVGSDLTPEVAARHAAAFGTILRGGRIVVATDTRPTGPIVREAAVAALMAVGCDVVDIGVAPTPTVPLAVSHFHAAGGVAVTASHNPVEWNALKFIGSAEEILPPAFLDRVYRLTDQGPIVYRSWDRVGKRQMVRGASELHVGRILALPQVTAPAIRRRRPKVVFDAGGGAAYEYGPALLERLGCRVVRLHCTPGPEFPRGPEPVPKNLKDLQAAVRRVHADMGFAVDPDSDRLAVVDESGRPLGEERTLVLATHWVLSRTPGPVVVNLSTTRAVLDVADAFNQRGYTSKVGEVNVAVMMKSKRAVVGGEGNGGVIMPALHPGRDALLGMALILSLQAREGTSISRIDSSLPMYYAAKRKLARPTDWPRRLERLRARYIQEHCDDRDGIKIDFDDGSIHARHSNTEPIVRISAESRTAKRASALLKEALGVLGF